MSKRVSRVGNCPTCGQMTTPSGHPEFDPAALAVRVEYGKPVCVHDVDLSRTTKQGLPLCALCRHALVTPRPAPAVTLVPQDLFDQSTTNEWMD